MGVVICGNSTMSRNGITGSRSAAFGAASTAWRAADSTFQSATPSTLAISSRLSLWVSEIDLSLRARRSVCAMALASR